jgi:hypothetical protein
MATAPYVGKDPATGSDSSVVTKKWADDQAAATRVDQAWVNAQIATEATNQALQLQPKTPPPSYVDQQDGLRAKKADVDLADQNYVPTSARGAANGVATLDTAGDVTASQVPSGLVLTRPILVYTASLDGTIYLQPGQTHECDTNTYREFQLATIPVPDPGYPWRPLVSGMVGGYSSGGVAPASGAKDSGNMGLVTVIPPDGVSDTIYGVGVCAAAYQTVGFYPVLPAGAGNQTPVTVPPIVGPLELGLWASCYTLTGYTYVGEGLFFQVQVFPAV